jgi:uncharacterized protein
MRSGSSNHSIGTASGETGACTFLRDMFVAVDRQDWAGLADFYCDDCRYERPGFAPILNRQALLQFYADIRPIAAGEHRLIATLKDGDFLFATGVFSGTLKSGHSIQLQFADLYETRNQRIYKRKTFFYTPLA